MNHRGSVMVVVLGLLAIMAMIGVTYLTMAGIDRSASEGFARQTHLEVAADGAVDYVSHHLVTDVWLKDGNNFKLLVRGGTGRNSTERYDVAHQSIDQHLAGPIDGDSPPNPRSYIALAGAQDPFGIDHTDNPTSNLPEPYSANDGVWNPHLTAPADRNIVMVSVTVLDHNGMINLNAHGNDVSGDWLYHNCQGQGYFVSDVDPGANESNLLKGTSAGERTVPGRWGYSSWAPDIAETGTTLIENPRPGGNLPFTLAEEYELRRPQGTYFMSRLEHMWSQLESDPDTGVLQDAKLRSTVVSWTAEVQGDTASGGHRTADGGNWSKPKADINLDDGDTIYEALKGVAFDESIDDQADKHKQFVANLLAYRSREIRPSYGGKKSIDRQPLLTEVRMTATTSGSGPDTETTYNVKVEVHNPWKGNFYGDVQGLNTDAFKIVIDLEGKGNEEFALPNTMAKGETWTSPDVTTATITGQNTKLSDAVKSIELQIGGDVCDVADLSKFQAGNLQSSIERAWAEDNDARVSGTQPLQVLYIGHWQWSPDGTPDDAPQSPSAKNNGVPIRLPKCVTAGAVGPLSPKPDVGGNFRAFPRVGDINQVLTIPPVDSNGVPWTVKVANGAGGANTEGNVKFNWRANSGGEFRAALAHNVLTVESPWMDGQDNDGDGKSDSQDKGTGTDNRVGGPEYRIAGKININTAPPDVLTALASGVGVSRASLNIPLNISQRGTNDGTVGFESVAEIISSSGAHAGSEAKGPLEKRDLPFTRISNIATVRSDVYSIYGTVRMIRADNKEVLQSRRFWALVDRSPSLAYAPNKNNFIHPRLLNFQWME